MYYAVGMYFRGKLDLSDLEDLENIAFLVDFKGFNSETMVVMKFPLPIWASERCRSAFLNMTFTVRRSVWPAEWRTAAGPFGPGDSQFEWL